jgi:hypothetical protein
MEDAFPWLVRRKRHHTKNSIRAALTGRPSFLSSVLATTVVCPQSRTKSASFAVITVDALPAAKTT